MMRVALKPASDGTKRRKESTLARWRAAMQAELKVFLTADKDIRTKRRYDELLAKGQPTDFEAVKRNLMERDMIDSNRADSPLRQAEDAILIDNSNLNPTEQLAKVLDLVHRLTPSV